IYFFFFQAEDGIRDFHVTGVQTCALPIEACYPGDAAWTPDRLREVRPREVAQALNVLGVRAQVQRLGIPDGGVEARSAALKATLRTLLQPGDLVLAPWEQDGHPDHDAVGRAALAAAAQPGMRLLRYPVWAWHWLLPH